jgi:hypothetical protein
MVGVVAFALPIVLIVAWAFTGKALPLSISGYYYTGLRNFFEGCLWAIATFQICCLGYDRKDEFAGIFSGVCAIGVALFATKPEF